MSIHSPQEVTMTPTAKLFSTMTAAELVAARRTTVERFEASTDDEQRLRLLAMIDELDAALATAWATAS
jgi:hypothetical protein